MTNQLDKHIFRRVGIEKFHTHLYEANLQVESI